MVNAQWPAALPQAALVAGLQSNPVPNATPIPVEAGELLTRQRFTGLMIKQPCSLILTTDEARLLLDFYRQDLGEVLPFDWVDPLTGEAVEYLFEGPPVFAPISTERWQANLALCTKPDVYTRAVLSFLGAQGSTTIRDTNPSGFRHTWTAAGDAVLDGNGALSVAGTGYVTTPDKPEFSLGSGEFTAVVRAEAAVGAAELNVAGQNNSAFSGTAVAWRLFKTAANVWSGQVKVGASTLFTITGATVVAPNSGVRHVAFQRVITDAADVLMLSLDGVPDATPVAITGSVNDSAANLSVGRAGEQASAEWEGEIHEFSLRVGKARWPTGSFTP